MFTSIKKSFNKATSSISHGYGATVNAVGNSIPGAGLKTYGNEDFSTIGSIRMNPTSGLDLLLSFKLAGSKILGIEQPTAISSDIIEKLASLEVKNMMSVMKESSSEAGEDSVEVKFDETLFKENSKVLVGETLDYFTAARNKAISDFLRESEIIGTSTSTKDKVKPTDTQTPKAPDVEDVPFKETLKTEEKDPVNEPTIQSEGTPVVELRDGVVTVDETALYNLAEKDRKEILVKVFAAASGLSEEEARNSLGLNEPSDSSENNKE